MESLIEQVKNLLTIEAAWKRLDLPGEPGRSCRIPWADDRRPSFSVFADGHRWHNHRDGQGGDVIDFVKEATGLSTPDALLWCAEQVGLRGGDGSVKPVVKHRVFRPQRTMMPEPWPTLREGTADERQMLAALRGLPMMGVELACNRGLLTFGQYDSSAPWRRHWLGLPFWAVTDEDRRLAELRRLDGEMWPEKDGVRLYRKAHTVGHGKDRPCGLVQAADFPVIALVEGAPDLVAAHCLVMCGGCSDHVGVTAILGAGVRQLCPESLPSFVGKHVRLFPHADDAGRSASRHWARQIKEAGAAVVDAFDLSGFITKAGQPGKDLADLCNISPASLGEQPDIFQKIFP